MATLLPRKLAFSSLALIALALIAAVMVTNTLLRGVRFDLTENDLYTLSDGTKRLLTKIDEPVNLYFYYSDRATAGIPALRTYATRVRELLEEFSGASDGKLILNVIDPLPFSEDEDRAAQFGLQAVSIANATDPVFLGLAGTNSVGDEETIGFFQPDKENFLEYELAKLISTLAVPEKVVVGLLSGTPMGPDFDPQTQQMIPGWVIDEQVRQLFELRTLDTSATRIDDDVSLLWIVQPKNLSSAALYTIDQFILGGGRALIFVDPLAEIDAPPPNPQMPGMPQPGQSSDLAALFDAWGLEYAATDVVADSRLGLQISGAGGRPVRHIGLLGIDNEHINNEDIITANLNSINVGMGGHISLRNDSPATLEPLLSSSDSAMTMPSSRFTFLPDPAALLDTFAPTGKSYVIGARIGGILNTAFPDGAPTVDPETPTPPTPETSSEHIAAAAEPVNVIVVADVDMLSDRLWAQSQSFFGQRITSAFADNGNFVINAIENLSGSAELISVRSRNTFSRPFTKVAELRARADALFRQTEQQLQSELDETERNLTELQSGRDDSGSLLLNPEQQAEVERFVNERTRIRKELRAVQRNLDADIERLGARLKVVNIGLLPFLLTVFGLVTLLRRHMRNKA